MFSLQANSHVAQIEAALAQYAATSSPKTVLIFDFDETLCHLHLPWGEYVAAVSTYLREIDTELFDTLIRQHDLAQVLNQFVEIHGDSVWQKEREMALAFESGKLEKAPLNLPMLDWIAANQNTYDFAIWSSNCVPTIELALGAYKNVFKTIVGKDLVKLTKPKPDGFVVIHEQVQSEDRAENVFPLHSFIMIGNNLIDDKGAAEQANIDFLHLHFMEG
jgi:FMN phosphatase YigB (HAD superfamily)